jgi:SAM-dependent methyltransferase
MKYEPIKKSVGNVFNKSPYLRILFYKLLDLLLLRSWHIKKELKQARKSLGENVKALDAGSGFGQYTHFLSTLSRTWKIKGVDVKEDQMEDCNQFFKKIGRGEQVNFSVADLTQFQMPDEFDLILSVDVMEHILDDVTVFKNFYQSLKTGGILLISTPSDQGGSDVHDHDHDSFIEEHVRDGYNILNIQEKLRFAGFSKMEAKFSYGTPGKISWKLSMKYPISLLNVSKLFFILLPFYYIITYPFCLILNFADVYSKHKTGTGLIVKAWK